jgi:hypothetical protein
MIMLQHPLPLGGLEAVYDACRPDVPSLAETS